MVYIDMVYIDMVVVIHTLINRMQSMAIQASCNSNELHFELKIIIYRQTYKLL